jgi:hypothetical protein
VSLTLRGAGSAVSAGLGVASWSRALLFTGTVTLIAAAGAFYFAVDWQKGRQARTELRDVMEVLDEQEVVLADLREIRKRYAEEREQLAATRRVHQQAMAEWLALPGLADDLCLDARGVELWNAANAGRPPRPATARPADPVPGDAATDPGRSQRAGDRQGNDAEPRAGRGTEMGLPDAPRGAGGVGRARDAGAR